jgi:hypothetical protein
VLVTEVLINAIIRCRTRYFRHAYHHTCDDIKCAVLHKMNTSRRRTHCSSLHNSFWEIHISVYWKNCIRRTSPWGNECHRVIEPAHLKRYEYIGKVIQWSCNRCSDVMKWHLKGSYGAPEVLEAESTSVQIDVVSASTGENGILFTECCSATLRKENSDILETTPPCNVSNSETGDLNKISFNKEHC